MSQTTDRGIRDNRLLIAIILGIAFLVAGGFYYQAGRNTAESTIGHT